jgi:hypothetical protein
MSANRTTVSFVGILTVVMLVGIQVAFEQLSILAVSTLEGQKNATHDRRLRTALVMRSMAPIQPAVLEKIYRLASELSMSDYPYDFWLLVDETRNNDTTQRLGNFFAKHGSHIELPKVFPVSEKIILEAYPNLTSYIYNEPEPNFNNESGVCCGFGFMWQMFVPAFALFMTEMQYKLGWSIEDDIGAHGQLTLLEMIRAWDSKLDPDVDLAAIEIKNQRWGMIRHSNNMEMILHDMRDQSVKWRAYSDSIQRHSLAMEEAVVAEVSRNVMQFGELLIHPIAWKHNRTFVDLNEVKANFSVFGLINMTGDKMTSSQGIEHLLNTPATPATFAFHERLPTANTL